MIDEPQGDVVVRDKIGTLWEKTSGGKWAIHSHPTAEYYWHELETCGPFNVYESQMSRVREKAQSKPKYPLEELASELINKATNFYNDVAPQVRWFVEGLAKK